jgi:quinoprotein glucose dehydrogenase
MLVRFVASLLFAASLLAAEQSGNAARGLGLEPLPASGEAEAAMKRFQIPPGFKIELFAAEPMLANPVAFSIDEKGRVFVAETYRHSAVGPAFRFFEGVFDIRSHMDWLEQDLASRSVEDRVQLMQRNLGTNFAKLTSISEKLRLLEDRNGDGKADISTVFAEGFNRAADGIGAGVLARRGDVYYTCLPDLWLLRDQDNDGKADVRESLHTGFGAHIAFLGHDLHGLRMGPDGRLYFSIGDRGLNVMTREGKPLVFPDEGTILRCEPDGSNLEVFARGLRNPQEVAFDDAGNLFTGDNNSDGGDRARWVYVVEGGDSGWRIGYQTLTAPPRRGPWNAERLWYPHFEGQPAYIVPPVANLGYGPSGLAFYPGTGLPEKYRGRFFLCDFRGGASSGIHSFDVRAKGAGFELGAYEQFIWETLPTDVEFGVEGGIYFSDWVETWNKTGKGRIYHVFDPSVDKALIAQTKALLNRKLATLDTDDLRKLLSHPDQRVRLDAQYTFAAKGDAGVTLLAQIVRSQTNRYEALHAIWGLGQVARRGSSAAQMSLMLATRQPDAELRAQVIKMLGDAPNPQSAQIVLPFLNDAEPRVSFFAAIALGHLKAAAAQPGLYNLLEQNADRDPWLRHAAVMGLAGIGDRAALRAAATNSSASIRLGACLALRRLEDSGIADFLRDSNLAIAAEAARAINDVPIERAIPSLASVISRNDLRVDSNSNTNAAKRSGVEAGVSAIAVETGVTSLPEQILLRVINANFRLGSDTNALALAEFAANQSHPANLRAEALAALADWAKPSGRDRVMGLWRPLPQRNGDAARAAVAPHLSDLLQADFPAVQAAAIQIVRQFTIREAVSKVAAIAKKTDASAALRVDALKTLAVVDRTRLGAVLESALASPSAELQREATRLQAEIDPPAALARVKDQLASPDPARQRVALGALGILPTQEADDILGAWLDRLAQGNVPAALQLDVLEAAGKRTSRAVLDRVQRHEQARPKGDQLAPFRECLEGGDAAEGKKIFYERAETFCSRCHQINGDGGEAGPKLTGIGGQQTRAYLLESIIFPNHKIAQGWENVILTMHNGQSFAGSVQSETDTQLTLNSPEDGEMTITKANIKSRHRALSAMPDEFRQILTKQELRNLVEFLATTR